MKARIYGAEFEDYESIKMPAGVSGIIKQFDDLNIEFLIDINVFKKMLLNYNAAAAKDKEELEAWLTNACNISKDLLFDETQVLLVLCCHIRQSWELLPKRTLKEHNAFYSKTSDLCNELIDCIESSGTSYVRGGGFGISRIKISDLFTDREKLSILSILAKDKEYENSSPEDEFPSVVEILQRLASASVRLKKQGPIHNQPNKAGAVNGYFVRELSFFMRNRYKSSSVKVISFLSSLILDDSIDEDLVKKHLLNPERSKSK